MANGKKAQRAVLVLLNCSFLWATIEMPSKKEQARRAKRICRDCPVVSECLEYALSNNLNETDDGIWGGMTPGERRELKRQITYRRIFG